MGRTRQTLPVLVAFVLGACSFGPAPDETAPSLGGPTEPGSSEPVTARPPQETIDAGGPNGDPPTGADRAQVATGGQTYLFTERERCAVNENVISGSFFTDDGVNLTVIPVGIGTAFWSIAMGQGLLWRAGDGREPLPFTVDGSHATWSGPATRLGSPTAEQATVQIDCAPAVLAGPPVGTLPVGRLLFSAPPIVPPYALDVWLLEAGSDTAVRLTEGGGNDRQPAWGRDGESVIVASDRIGGDSRYSAGIRAYALYVVGFDGSEPLYLFGEHSFNHSPEYSPDGSKLMFQSDRGGTTQVYVVDADAAATTPFEGWQKLTDLEFAAEGSWSPDGTRIAFSGIADGNRDIYVLDADGGNLMRLTEHPGRDDAPDWSPDGTQIAYMSEASGTNTDIFVMDADGTNARQLTQHEQFAGYPSWSPDGAWIAYDHQQTSGIVASGIDIYVMRADGSDVVNVTGALQVIGLVGQFPAWGP